MALPVGTLAPGFSLRSMSEEGLVDLQLSDYRGRVVVLLFVPGAFTRVCTLELCSRNESLSELADSKAVVIGISPDSAFVQAAWAKQDGINILLASDYQREVTRAYQVEAPDLAGHGPTTARAAFVIDKDGIISYSEETETLRDLPDFESIAATVNGLI